MTASVFATPPASAADTYGELLPSSLTTCFALVDWQSTDVFVDLGSGLGHAVCQAFEETPVQGSVGIECCPTRHQQALEAQSVWLQKQPPERLQGRFLQSVLGDFLTYDVSQATVIYICATAFPLELLVLIAKKLNQHTNIHTVLTTRPLPFLRHLTYKKRVRVEGTWDTTFIYLYKTKAVIPTY